MIVSNSSDQHEPAQFDQSSAIPKKLLLSSKFPVRLYRMLELAGTEIVSWLSHGRAFLVKNSELFAADILPRYLKQTKYQSFRRILNLYGFKLIIRGPDKGAYYHKYFQKEHPELLEDLLGCFKSSNQNPTQTSHTAHSPTTTHNTNSFVENENENRLLDMSDTHSYFMNSRNSTTSPSPRELILSSSLPHSINYETVTNYSHSHSHHHPLPLPPSSHSPHTTQYSHSSSRSPLYHINHHPPSLSTSTTTTTTTNTNCHMNHTTLNLNTHTDIRYPHPPHPPHPPLPSSTPIILVSDIYGNLYHPIQVQSIPTTTTTTTTTSTIANTSSTHSATTVFPNESHTNVSYYPTILTPSSPYTYIHPHSIHSTTPHIHSTTPHIHTTIPSYNNTVQYTLVPHQFNQSSSSSSSSPSSQQIPVHISNPSPYVTNSSIPTTHTISNHHDITPIISSNPTRMNSTHTLNPQQHCSLPHTQNKHTTSSNTQFRDTIVLPYESSTKNRIFPPLSSQSSEWIPTTTHITTNTCISKPNHDTTFRNDMIQLNTNSDDISDISSCLEYKSKGRVYSPRESRNNNSHNSHNNTYIQSIRSIQSPQPTCTFITSHQKLNHIEEFRMKSMEVQSSNSDNKGTNNNTPAYTYSDTGNHNPMTELMKMKLGGNNKNNGSLDNIEQGGTAETHNTHNTSFNHNTNHDTPTTPITTITAITKSAAAAAADEEEEEKAEQEVKEKEKINKMDVHIHVDVNSLDFDKVPSKTASASHETANNETAYHETVISIPCNDHAEHVNNTKIMNKDEVEEKEVDRYILQSTILSSKNHDIIVRKDSSELVRIQINIALVRQFGDLYYISPEKDFIVHINEHLQSTCYNMILQPQIPVITSISPSPTTQDIANHTRINNESGTNTTQVPVTSTSNSTLT